MAPKPKDEPWQLLDEVDEPIDPSPHPPDIGAQFARRNSAAMAATTTHHDRDGRVRDWLQKTMSGSQRKVVPENDIDIFPDEDPTLRNQPHSPQDYLSQDPPQSFQGDNESVHHEGSEIHSFSSPSAQSFNPPVFPPESLDGYSTDSKQGSLGPSKCQDKDTFFNPSHHQAVDQTISRPDRHILDDQQHSPPPPTPRNGSLSPSSFVRSQCDTVSVHSPKHTFSPRQQLPPPDSDASTVGYDPAESVHSPRSHAPTDEDDDLMVPPGIWEHLSYVAIPKKREHHQDEEFNEPTLDVDDDDDRLSSNPNQSVSSQRPKAIQPSIENYLVSLKPESLSPQQQEEDYDLSDPLFSACSSLSTAKSFSSLKSLNTPSEEAQSHPTSLGRSESSGGIVSHLNFSITSTFNSAEIQALNSTKDEGSSHQKSAFMLRPKRTSPSGKRSRRK